MTHLDVDWDGLAHLGVPLTVQRAGDAGPDRAEFPERIREAARVLAARHAPVDGGPRERDALQALLWALWGHFPTTWHAWFNDAPEVQALLPAEPSERVLRLSRIARERLAEFL